MERPRLEGALSAATDAHRLTLVVGPAGYGKSTALGGWVRAGGLPSAWLSLDRFDNQPVRLFHGVVGAIRSAARKLSPPASSALLALDRGMARDSAESYDLLLGALEYLTEPMALVIDDVHLAGPDLARGVVGVLAASAPPALRLVLSARGHPAIPLEKLRYGEGLGEVSAADLAFTRDEVAQFAWSFGQNEGFDSDSLWNLTAGWPVIVHASLAALGQAVSSQDTTTPAPAHVALADYVAEEVLDQEDASLADFVLRATTSDWLGRPLAIELAGQRNGGMLLEECLRKGLFIEEHDYRGGESIFRWQGLFAAQCRRLLERRDPVLCERLHRVAARYYQDVDVCECVAQALQGHSPRQAVMSLGAHWLEFVLRNDAYTLEQLCQELPAPWNVDPETLMIRSVCRALAGDSDTSSELIRRALAGAAELDEARRRRLDNWRGTFERSANAGRPDAHAPATYSPAVDSSPGGQPRSYSTALFLLGQAEFRLSSDGDPPASLFQAAGGAAKGKQLTAVEVCAEAELALAFAAAGDLVTAAERGTDALERADALGFSLQGRMAAAWLARGIACYWGDDLNGARVNLSRALRLGGALFPLARVSAVYRVLVDCATSDQTHLADSSAALDSFHDKGMYGVSWNAFHIITKAKIAEAKGDLDGALRIVQPLGTGGHAPLVDALLAELLRCGGETTAARHCAESLSRHKRSSFVDTSMSLTEALLAQQDGDSARAHERIERAVYRAEPQGVLRPFAERKDELAELVAEHAVWGTNYGSFIAARMVPQVPVPLGQEQSYWSLTERELEVLAYMRSIMTAAEIAEALFISVNTVKTHERSIYRKLGAASRRDALKAAAERGIV